MNIRVLSDFKTTVDSGNVVVGTIEVLNSDRAIGVLEERNRTLTVSSKGLDENTKCELNSQRAITNDRNVILKLFPFDYTFRSGRKYTIEIVPHYDYVLNDTVVLLNKAKTIRELIEIAVGGCNNIYASVILENSKSTIKRTRNKYTPPALLYTFEVAVEKGITPEQLMGILTKTIEPFAKIKRSSMTDIS